VVVDEMCVRGGEDKDDNISQEEKEEGEKDVEGRGGKL
jgi:hypothetical protein